MTKILITIGLFLTAITTGAQKSSPLLKISANKRYFQTAGGKPFFWLGDTGWLLFTKCTREQSVQYLETRKQQGFNVIQVMVLHTIRAVDVYGDSALVNGDIAHPKTKQNSHAEHDYWGHIDFVINEAAKRGIYLALVPVWGSNVKEGKVTVSQAGAYAKFLAERYGRYNNIIWLNGGDIKGSDGLDVWNTIGTTIKKYDQKHLVGFHPRGRTSSSEWFQQAGWLDFNMFQSGHKDYTQDTSSNEKHHFGEDNWKFIQADYAQTPVKPTMDGEPSYENIPHGLHDSLASRWSAADVRRYAYWSVLAGGAGFTYGENAVMQFNTMGNKGANYGVSKNWTETIHAEGAEQMKYLKQLVLSKSYFSRRPAQEIIADNTQDKYGYVVAAKGTNYAMAYTYTGRNFSVNLSKLSFKVRAAAWFDPKNGHAEAAGKFGKTGVVEFNPPGDEKAGNDWVLLLQGANK
jgi:hypothetical protein